MACKTHKLYHDRDFDTRGLLDTYFSSKSDMAFGDDSLRYPMEKLHNILSSGLIKGNTLIDMTISAQIHHLYSVCKCFKEIIVMRFNERCIMELNKWRHDRTGAFDWSHTASYIKQLDKESDQEEKDIQLKKAITHVLKCDINKDNLIEPLVIPQADCLLSVWLLECISKNEEEYIKNLRKFLNYLKIGGILILFGVLNVSYYMVGKQKFHAFSYDESFIRKVFPQEGLKINHFEVLESKVKSDKTDYKGLMFLTACKEK